MTAASPSRGAFAAAAAGPPAAARWLVIRIVRIVRSGLWAAVVVGTVTATASARALAQPLATAPGAAAPASAMAAAEARGWLMRMQAAARSANFRGTMVYGAGGEMSSSRVAHYAVGGDTVESMESLDGRQQRVVRHNDAVHTLWPQTRVAVIEKREAPAAWSATPQTVDPLALEQYEMRREGSARVAGRDAVVLWLEPRDRLRHAQRLWADRETALMLRADVHGPAPAPDAPRPVLESTAFSSVEIGVRPQTDAALASMQALEGYRIVRPQQRRTTLDAEGWALARPVAGFRFAGCVLRGMDNAGSREAVLQAVFTDGLTHVSLFVEPYRAEIHRAEAQAHQGATASLTQRGGQHWFTAVGNVPAAALKLFVVALDRRGP